MTENELRAQIKDEFKSTRPSAQLSWIESHATSAGFPDLDVWHLTQGVQVELKVVKARGAIEIRPTQYRWHKDRVKAGGRSVLLVGSDSGYYVLPGTAISQPDALTNVSQIESRPHFYVTTIAGAIDAAFLIAEFGSVVCPR